MKAISTSPFTILSLLAAFTVQSAHASPVIADFNDLATGGLDGQAGGTGFTGNWVGSGATVIAGDMTAPASTGYALTQSGTAQKARVTSSSKTKQSRDLSTDLTGDTVWFSYLMQNSETKNARIGLTFNNTHRVFAYNQTTVGTGQHYLFLDKSTHSDNRNLWANSGQGTVLILGKITVDDTGDDIIDLWADPNVSSGEAGLGTVTLTNTFDYFGAAGITNIALHGVGASSYIDNIHFSDGPDGFAAVTGVPTGVPEPSTSLLAIVGMLGLIARRRR